MQARWRGGRRRARGWLRLLVGLGLWWLIPRASQAAEIAAVDAIELPARYVAAGETLAGRVRLDVPEGGGGYLLVTAHTTVDVPTNRNGHAGTRHETVYAGAVKGTAAVAVPIAVKAEGVLVGGLRLRATVFDRPGGTALSSAWSETVTVGVRRRLSLAGDWTVLDARPFPFGVGGQKEPYRPERLPETIRLPGTLDESGLTGKFRGWVTVKRTVPLKTGAALQPRLFYVHGASDSVKVAVGGVTIGEALPEADLDHSLSHWLYFHGFRTNPHIPKSDENKHFIRLIQSLEPHAPMRWPLPPAALARGTLEVQMELRGTSGGHAYAQRVPYGILGDLHCELLPAVFVRSVAFDTTKPSDERRFHFRLAITNAGDQPFAGTIRTVYGQYEGAVPYTGACPSVDEATQAVSVLPGTHTVEVVRDEVPRFAACRATFILQGQAGKILDAATQDYHPVTVEIRDRRDLYVNNERFIMKGRGSHDTSRNQRWQLLINGTNTRRGMGRRPSRVFPALQSTADWVDDRLAEGLLHDTGPLLASCERCTFWDPDDMSRIERAVRHHVLRRGLYQCPGLIQWEATNELHGEPEEARIAITRLFHKLDPYHRPVCMTKGSGEWEAEAREGKVAGVDVVGVQYLNTKTATDSITATITEHPIMSTEINWNDGNMIAQDLWSYWLDKGICGALLFDYSGHSTDQPVPLAPPRDGRDWSTIQSSHRDMYQDLLASAVLRDDGRVALTVGNRMPYPLRNVVLQVQGVAEFDGAVLEPGDALTMDLPASAVRRAPHYAPDHVPVFARYTTHRGLPHVAALTPDVREGGK